jgi:hypothetical protein
MSRQPNQDLIEGDAIAVLAKLGANDIQQQDGGALLPRYLEQRNGLTVVKATGVALDTDQGHEWLRTEKPHLLPRAFEESLADAAFLGTYNATKMQELSRTVTPDELNAIARSYGRKSAFDSKPPEDRTDIRKGRSASGDPKRNAWLDQSPQGEARRIAALSSLPTKVCQEFAAAAGVDLAGRPLRRSA